MLAPNDPDLRRARGLVLLALLTACDGRGAQAAGQAAAGFGEAMRMVAIILLVLATLGAIVYLSIWWWLIASWRRGRASRAAAVLLLLVHAGALLLAGTEPDLVAHRWLWWTAPLPAAAIAVAFATRLPARLAVGVVATAGLCLLPARTPPLAALSAPVVDLSSAFIHACVVLQSGALVCAGDEAATCDGEPDGSRFAARRVEEMSDVDRVHTASGLTCVRRRAGPAVCCGGSRALPTPRAPQGPWQLPIGGPDASFAVTANQILARAGDALQAWPHPLPAGLGSARALTASEGLDDHFAVVDRDGELWMWQQDGARIARLARFPGLTDAEEVAVQARTGACVRRTSGAVSCFPWPDRGDPPFEVPDLRAIQLVALDDAFDSFCVRTPAGAVLCWSEDDPPRPFADLPTATRLVSTNSALCDVAATVRCAPVMHDVDRPLVDLLALPVAP